MKKLIAMIVTVCVMLGMCTTAFAATTPEVAENGAITISDGAFTVDGTKVTLAEGEAIANNTQTTIVVVEGTAINTNSIQYINQGEATSFTFVPKDDATYKAGNETVILTAYIGGDEINKATAGTITYAAAEAQKFTVTFKVGDTANATEYDEGADIVVPENPTKEADAEYTYTFAGWYVEGDETQTAVDLTGAKATATVTYVAKFTATPIPSGGETVTISYQMVKVDISSTTADATVSTAEMNSTDVVYTTLSEPTLSNYAFIGWYTDEALTTKLDKAAAASAITGTIYAKMAKLYKLGNINLDTRNGGLVNAQDIELLTNWFLDNSISDIMTKVVPGTTVKFGNINGDTRNGGLVNAQDIELLKNWFLDNSISDTINKNFEVTKD